MTSPEDLSPETIATALQKAIESKIPEAKVTVTIGNPGHYTLDVRAPQFEGQSTLERQRTVYSAISKWMAGNNAPVHAIDQMITGV